MKLIEGGKLQFQSSPDPEAGRNSVPDMYEVEQLVKEGK